MLRFIDDLLQGAPVEWKTLGEIGVFYGGLTGKNRRDFEKGGATYIPYKNIFDNLSVNPERLEEVYLAAEEHQNEVCYGDVLFTLSSETQEEVGISSVVTVNFSEPVYLNSFSFGMRFKENVKVLPEFAKHLFRSSLVRRQIIRTANGVTRFNISKTLFKNISIPLPPLHVQEKIVAVLDKFTALERELGTKLETELVLRQKQYEYYRNKLLTFGEEVEWERLGAVTKIFSGKNKERSGNGIYPIYGSTGIIGHTDYCEYTTEQLLVARVGANAGYVHIANGEYAVSDNTLIVQNSDCLLLKFLYFILVNRELNKLSKGGAQPLITGGQLKEVLIPLPSLTEQARIVSLLDKFDTLTNSLTEGLPREIALRHKQYEYYRDQLLTFPKN